MTCCKRCTTEYVRAHPATKDELMFGFLDARVSMMFLCKLCGNKRCPHATDHRHDCTDSNAPGQTGSSYA